MTNEGVLIRDGETESLLAAFGEYLLRSRIVEEKHARYYVSWARQFLGRPAVMPNATPNEALTGFLDTMERDGREDWQVEQARKAVTAWLGGRQRTEETAPAPKAAPAPDGSVVADDALALLRDTCETGATVEGRPVETTMIYTQVVKDLRSAPRSPLDAL